MSHHEKVESYSSDKSHGTKMKFELLPNEVWLEIFSYIHIGDITHAFLRLNNRLTNLIHSLPTNVHHYETNES